LRNQTGDVVWKQKTELYQQNKRTLTRLVSCFTPKPTNIGEFTVIIPPPRAKRQPLGDQLVIGPPFIVADEQLDEIVGLLETLNSITF
jgi:hypothetical protein